MFSSKQADSTNNVLEILGDVRRKGVRLWAEDGHLRYQAPKGALTRQDLARLTASRDQLVALLEGAIGTAAVSPGLQSSERCTERIPLTYPQLSHWHLYRLNERPHLRQIASATRLCGRLNRAALHSALTELIRRHEALRTQFLVVDGVPMQVVSESGDCELANDDLTTLPANLREVETQRLIEKHVLEPVDVTMGPLFGVRLLRLRDDEHVLIVAMEHLISDGMSMSILLRDLFTAYRQIVNDRAISLPPIPVQFSDYALWQRKAENTWIKKHGQYWKNRLVGCQRTRFPDDNGLRTKTSLGWGSVPIEIDRELKAALREWCQLRGTTLVMGVFTAYVALVLRWCNVAEAVIRYQTDGRTNCELENTVGYLAAVLHLRVELLEDDNLLDLMQRVIEEYCNAYEHIDFGYVEAQAPQAEFTRNSAFNWLPQGSQTHFSGSDGSEDAIRCSSVPFEHPMRKKLVRDTEPVVLLFDADDGIVGGVHFPLNRFSMETMKRFGRHFLTLITALLQQPERCVRDLVLL